MVGALVLFVIGTSVQAGWLLLLSSLLLGAVVVGLVLPRRMLCGVEVERRAPAEAFQGDEVPIELVVRNGSRGLRLSLAVDDPHVALARMFVPSLAPGERVLIGTARRASRRGVQESTEVRLSSSAPFGVGEARRPLPAAGRTIVFPAVARLGRVPIVDDVPSIVHPVRSAPRRGAGPEYLGIREYRTGDSMRHVHWPSTARHGAVMVREFEREHTRRLAIVVDTWADEGVEDTPLDTACSVAASLALSAAGRGQGIRLVGAQAGEMQTLARAEPQRILGWLAELRPFGGLALIDVVRGLRVRMRGVDTVVLVLPTWRANAADALAAGLGELRSSFSRVSAILIDVGAHGVGGRSARRPAWLSTDEVDSLASALTARGVDVYRLRAGEDLETCLQRPVTRPA